MFYHHYARAFQSKQNDESYSSDQSADCYKSLQYRLSAVSEDLPVRMVPDQNERGDIRLDIGIPLTNFDQPKTTNWKRLSLAHRLALYPYDQQ
jgi:hypothetical protein